MELTAKQASVLEPDPRNKLVVVGRRWGKSVTAAHLALKKMKEDPGCRKVTIYKHNWGSARRMTGLIRDIVAERGILCREDRPNVISFYGGGEIEVKVFEDQGDVIFDDAFLVNRSTAIFMTPSHWGLTQGPSSDNPTVEEEQKRHLKSMMSDEMFKGEVLGEF
jgi:hypothetical protein